LPASESEREGEREIEADVYVLNTSTEDLRHRVYLSLYPRDAPYQPIAHIQVKQVAYYGQASSWGKTEMVIETNKPTH
jgi:hypothetical protein